FTGASIAFGLRLHGLFSDPDPLSGAMESASVPGTSCWIPFDHELTGHPCPLEKWMFVSVVQRSSLLARIALLAACQTAPPAPPEVPQIPVYVDPTPPSVRLQTEGLRHNVVLDHASKRGMLRRVRSSDQVRFVATGADRETGVRQLGLQGEVRVNCLPVPNPQYLKAPADKMLARMEPIHEELVPQVERV